MSTGPNDPLAAILAEAEANRRRDRAASQAAVSTSVPAAEGNFTVTNVGAGMPALRDEQGKVPQTALYPAAAGQTGATFDWTQAVALQVWTVAHNLNGYPNVVVRDAQGSEIIPEIDPVDLNSTRIVFGRPTAGSASFSL